MIRLVADENLNGYIIAGVVRRLSRVDLVTATEVGLKGATDPELMGWAAREDRVLLTHDIITTLLHFANERMRRGQPMSGVIAINRDLRLSESIEDWSLLLNAARQLTGPGEFHFFRFAKKRKMQALPFPICQR